MYNNEGNNIMKLNFDRTTRHFEAFLADDTFFYDTTEIFMKKHLSEDMEEEEAIKLLEDNFLFNEKMNKSDALTAADALRAIRMEIFYRKRREDAAKL